MVALYFSFNFDVVMAREKPNIYLLHDLDWKSRMLFLKSTIKDLKQLRFSYIGGTMKNFTNTMESS